MSRFGDLIAGAAAPAPAAPAAPAAPEPPKVEVVEVPEPVTEEVVEQSKATGKTFRGRKRKKS